MMVVLEVETVAVAVAKGHDNGGTNLRSWGFLCVVEENEKK